MTQRLVRARVRFLPLACILVGLCQLVFLGLDAADAAQQSGPIALSGDNRLLVNVNPDHNTVTVHDVTQNRPNRKGEVRVGRDPRSVAIHRTSPLAYAANASDGTVSVIDIDRRKVLHTLAVGKEPSHCVLSPNGSRLYVSNTSSNSLSVIDTTVNPPVVSATVDLSSQGTAPGTIGVTDDGDADDTDETVFVAMFFAQLRPGKSSVDEGQDDQREGHVAAISSATNTILGAPSPIVLGPLANAGFNANGRLSPGPGQVPAVPSTNPQTFTTPTGCFPNQLASLAIHPTNGRAYVVSTGASPNGPFRFNSNAQGMVSLFETTTRVEVTSAQTGAAVRQTAPLNLNQGVNLATTPAPRLFMTNPVAMAWRPDGSDAWIAVQTSDMVVRLTVDAGGIPTVSNPLVAGPSSLVRVDLLNVPGDEIPGKAPRGIVINSSGTRAYVWNFTSQSVTAIDISIPLSPVIIGSRRAVSSRGNSEVVLGAELFYTGRGPEERMSSEAWGGCVVCHPNGRSDNVTWMFPDGPRQTIGLDGMFKRNDFHDQRILNWSAVRDENQDFELNTRGVFGGRGLIDDDRTFFALCGASGPEPLDSRTADLFNQATGVVSTPTIKDRNKLTQPRFDFGIATLDDGRIFLIGGRENKNGLELVDGDETIIEFNPRTNKVRKRTDRGFTLRHSLGAVGVRTAQGYRIYAIGGYASVDPNAAPVSTVQEFNPDTNTWRTVASLPTGVAQFGITRAGGINTAAPLQLIHVVGGNIGSEATPDVAGNPANVQRFQPDPIGPGTWSTFDPAGLTKRRNHGIATALRGVQERIFVIGGQDTAGTVLDTVEEYLAQAVTTVATPHTSLPAPRARFGIGHSLSTNQIYVMGGVDSAGTDQTTIFEYTIANNGPVAGPSGTPSGTWVTRGNLPTARRSLGVSSPPGVTNFLTAKSAGRDPRQDAIAAWIARNVRAARAPVSATDPDALAGRTLFGTTGLVVASFSCASCHGGAKWTRSIVDFTAPPSPEVGVGLGDERVIGAELRQTTAQGPNVLNNVGTFTVGGGRVNEVRFNGADISQAVNPLGANGFNIPSLLSVHETAPYYYSGLAQTLEDVLNGSQDGFGGVRHHFVTNAAQRAQLIAFLRSIDDTTPIFP